ncbi:MAG: S49 family peptidase [Rhodobacteraceae bacterium]|nr:S49 family peptidase [Paracoccaceae bacterium]
MKRFLPFLNKTPVVSVVRLNGTIGIGGRMSLNDQALAPVLERAFRRNKPVAVAIELNSPGGSPVQSSLICARIRRLADKYNVPVLAFVEDVATSGGYWLAAAADEIYTDSSSILGSIGVISARFGAHVLMARQGVERRIYTAGQSKSMFDPFCPENPEDVARLKTLLTDIHLNFIDHVKARRGDKLATDTDLFTGEVWLARKALDLGLIDGIGHLHPVINDRFGDKVKFRRYGMSRSPWPRLGFQVADAAMGAIEERVAFARFGL